MTELNKNLTARLSPSAAEENIVLGDGWRITVLTDRLLRIETSDVNEFCDEATQAIWNRATPPVKFRLDELDGSMLIVTERASFRFSAKRRKITSIKVDGKRVPCKDKGNLLGTCRTLDMRAGKVKLGKGVISKTGAAFFYDDGLAVRPDGTVGKRKTDGGDLYVFAYGRDYRGAMRDFYLISGSVPMLPRYALGNWWSRYRKYTQEEYLALMERFEQEKLPFTVATVDMDWHWVDVNRRFEASFKPAGFGNGPGWTGYSWNNELFPDYRDFLRKLREKNLRVTLNLHPSSGIRFYEDMYPAVAEATGVDPSSKETVPFDLSDNAFLNAYFDLVHHPYEEEGVDFWWIDWQQGKKSSVPGLDPLWALNHYHYLDNARNGKRGLILSRFAGTGSHRYPLGFSGDSMTYWRSLRFQPYMTATAANIGYGWWSHDIGGHNFGIYDDELYLRWCQYGVFSPINRLHSSAHDLQGKEPWKHSETVRRITGDFLRLRHRLIPYIYSAMKAASSEGRALCEPMYYEYPYDERSYSARNEYFFGSELVVCPVTSPLCKELNMAKTELWVPEGRFTDIFTGKIYHGNKVLSVFRDLESITVLAKSGAIIPLSCVEGNDCGSPSRMEVWIYRGDNTYTLYEDDGLTAAHESGEYAETVFTVRESEGKLTFNVSAPRYGTADGSFRLPEDRTYVLNFRDVSGGTAKADGREVPFDGTIEVRGAAEVELTGYAPASNGDPAENARVILSRYQKGTISKMIKYFGMGKITDVRLLAEKTARRFPKNVYLALLEAIER